MLGVTPLVVSAPPPCLSLTSSLHRLRFSLCCEGGLISPGVKLLHSVRAGSVVALPDLPRISGIRYTLKERFAGTIVRPWCAAVRTQEGGAQCQHAAFPGVDLVDCRASGNQLSYPLQRADQEAETWRRRGRCRGGSLSGIARTCSCRGVPPEFSAGGFA